MTIEELLDMAKYGELRNLKLGSEENAALLSYINLGLIELYKRFPLKVKEAVIELVDSPNNEYPLPSDCMWLVTAFGEVPENQSQYTSWELAINNEDDPLSINTVSWNTIQVPVTMEGSYISLIYAASPNTIKFTETEFTEGTVTIPANTYWQYIDDVPTVIRDIDLPIQLIEPLLFYIGYRAHGAMDGNIQSESNTHYMRFDKSCQKIKTEGMFTNDNLDMKYRVREKGFV